MSGSRMTLTLNTTLETFYGGLERLKYWTIDTYSNSQTNGPRYSGMMSNAFWYSLFPAFFRNSLSWKYHDVARRRLLWKNVVMLHGNCIFFVKYTVKVKAGVFIRMWMFFETIFEKILTGNWSFYLLSFYILSFIILICSLYELAALITLYLAQLNTS